jgi:hypothetical protein
MMAVTAADAEAIVPETAAVVAVAVEDAAVVAAAVGDAVVADAAAVEDVAEGAVESLFSSFWKIGGFMQDFSIPPAPWGTETVMIMPVPLYEGSFTRHWNFIEFIK